MPQGSSFSHPCPSIAYQVDEHGQCQAMPYPSHAHFLQMAQARGLDHILYYPPDVTSPRFVVYLSLQHKVLFILPLDATMGTEDMSRLYAWVLQNRRTHAYPYLRLQIVRPSPNESKSSPAHIAEWCDAQIDAFTLYHCRQQLLTARPGTTAARAGRPRRVTARGGRGNP